MKPFDIKQDGPWWALTDRTRCPVHVSRHKTWGRAWAALEVRVLLARLKGRL